MTPTEIWLAYNAAENERDFVLMERFISEDLSVTVNGRAAVSSVEDDIAAMAAMFETYPDYRRDVTEVIDAGTRGIVRWTMHGTPLPGSNVVPLDVAGCSVVETAGGRMTVAHLYYDGAALDAVINGAAGESA